MMRRAALFAVAVMVLTAPASLAQPASAPAGPWQRAIGSWAWSFPRDHGVHPNFKTEWWYFTGNLKEEKTGRPFGYQLTIFRQGVQYTPAQKNSKWAVRDVYFGHFTISDIAEGKFHAAETVSRAVMGDVKFTTDAMNIVMPRYAITETGATEQFHLTAIEPDFGIDFELHPLKPLILEGVGGLSQKSSGEGEASYYYSYPRLDTGGRIKLGDKMYDVSGLSWFDHEFSTSSLGKDEVGWDWFCIQLDDKQEIMLYALRDKSGAIDPASEGTWVRADGTSARIPPGGFTIAKSGTWHSPHSGATYPSRWHITIPSHEADLVVTPAMADQELNLNKMGRIVYWEGASSVEGTVAGQPAKGVGYTELTGYAGTLQTGLNQ